jgi:DNA-binding response OmpR family regulator
MEPILVIYENPASRCTVQWILEDAGYEVTSVACGPVAMKVFLATTPRLVILDVGPSGNLVRDHCRQIRRRSRNVSLFVLGDQADALSFLKLGVDGYLAKPFSPLELVARVRVALRHLAS